MKKFIMNMACLFALSSAHASNMATMQMKISGDIKDTYYLCINNAGCVNLAAGTKGKSFPINSGNIDYLFIANASNVRMYPQQLLISCAITINDNRILTVSGKIAKSANDKIYLRNLHCAVG